MQEYTHIETGRTVTLLDDVNIRTPMGDWEPGVVYRVNDSGSVYARPAAEFREKFVPAPQVQLQTPQPS